MLEGRARSRQSLDHCLAWSHSKYKHSIWLMAQFCLLLSPSCMQTCIQSRLPESTEPLNSVHVDRFHKGGPAGSRPTDTHRQLLDQGLITCTLLYKSKVKLEAMAMEKVLQLENEALDKELKETTCLHLVAEAGAPPSDEYINELGGEVVLTEYHPGFFKLYPKLVLKMTSSKLRLSLPSSWPMP